MVWLSNSSTSSAQVEGQSCGQTEKPVLMLGRMFMGRECTGKQENEKGGWPASVRNYVFNRSEAERPAPSPDRRLGEGARRADEGSSEARVVPLAPPSRFQRVGPHPALRATFSHARAWEKGEAELRQCL